MNKAYDRYDIFLSFSNYDKHIAEEIADQIIKAGLKCFMSGKDLLAGEMWEPRIRDAIRRSDRILLLITPRSKGSRWVFLETGAAWMQEIEIIPLTQFVDPEELREPVKEFHVRPIVTSRQISALIEELKSPKKERPLPFSTILTSIRSAVAEMNRARVFPDIVVGSGRDGAVCAGIFAEILGQKKLKVIDCQFAYRGKDRETKIDPSSLQEDDIKRRNVLVVEWARQTGLTYELIEEKLSFPEYRNVKSRILLQVGIES